MEYKIAKKSKVIFSIMTFKSIVVICLISALQYGCCAFADGKLRDTPSEAMEKFIDECNKMVDMMNHCEQGWVALEEEVIDSVNSFADRIVYTEHLILDEAGEILSMADRIIQTEDIMIDLIETCGCVNDKSIKTSVFELSPPPSLQASSQYHAPVPLSKQLHSTALVNATFDTCSAMDMAMEVMDACINLFEEFNDDFLEVLSYMDYAIQDMGDRIVDTECLVMNMSRQIGVMADRIVEVEQLTTDMMKGCCVKSSPFFSLRGGSVQPKHATNTSRLLLEDDDLWLSHCKEWDGGKRSSKISLHSILDSAIKILQSGKTAFQQSLRSAPIASFLQATMQSSKVAVRKGDDDGGIMPCETFWNPFCCAAEVCAHMMVEMIDMMSTSFDSMTDMCKNIIDEIGKLADDIVKTEEDIILMGYAIGDMSDCIVVFIDSGLDMMAEFCPSSKGYALKGKHDRVTEGSCGDVSKRLQALTMSSEELQKVKLLLGVETLQQKLALLKATMSHQFAAVTNHVENLKKHLGTDLGGPFGDFAAMVDACTDMMRTMTNMFASQIASLSTIMTNVNGLAKEQRSMNGMVLDMNQDVNSLGTEVGKENNSMNKLVSCMENK